MPSPIERLEQRLQYASISGVIWNDLDASQTYDANESPLRKWDVFIDANANGRWDKGEPIATTDLHGRYTFTGLNATNYLVGVIPPAGYGQTSPGPLGAASGDFTINLKFNDTLTAVQRDAFATAAQRWESIINGETFDGKVESGSTTISVSVDHIDGVDGTLAQSDPTNFSSANQLPTAGETEFDEADIGELQTDNQLVSTITHEMAHVLGFGTIWDTLGLIANEGTRNTAFTGAAAVAAYDQLFDTNATSVPLENTGGDGTADSHWRESVFHEELMTGYVEDPGVFEPLSRVTVAQFQDLGYAVNLNAADVWNPLTHASTPTTPLTIGAKAFERLVDVKDDGNITDANFGYRADTAPVIQTFTASPTRVTRGSDVTLSVSNVADAQHDGVAGITFWRESNGIPGLQTGHGGDTYIATKITPKHRAWQVETATTGLAAGEQAYYAVALDDLGLASKTRLFVDIRKPAALTRAPTAAASTAPVEDVIKLIDGDAMPA